MNRRSFFVIFLVLHTIISLLFLIFIDDLFISGILIGTWLAYFISTLILSFLFLIFAIVRILKTKVIRYYVFTSLLLILNQIFLFQSANIFEELVSIF